jgi:hypothetical protein
MPETVSASSPSNSEGLKTAIYQSIARQIRDGNCVLFLGPGAVAVQQADGSQRPLIELCALHLAKGLGLKPEEEESLTHVTSSLRMRGALSDTLIIAAVQDFYQQSEKEAISPVLSDLANLPFRIIINTTPDDYFTRYYAQSLRDFRFDFYNFRKPNPDPLYKFGDDQPPLIYNLFGSYKKPESLVLTYSDQLSYINKITGAQHERLPDSLLAAFNVPRFYLFLGFDFEDWTLRITCDALFRNSRNHITPFAYTLKGEPEAGTKSKVFFQSEFKMEFPQVDLVTFAENLLKHYAALDGNAAGSGDKAETRANVLILHNEKADEEGCKTFLNYLKPLRLKVTTLRDATGQGDLTAWIQTQMDNAQIVIPLISPDFFDDSNPALPLLEALAKRNNPPAKFLVMPIILKTFSLDGTPLGSLPTVRPLKSGANYNAVYGEGNENQHFTNIARALGTYLDSIT